MGNDPTIAGTGVVVGQDVSTFVNETIDGGSVTIYDSTCAGSTYTAGQSFVAPGYGSAHIARNEGATNTELVLINVDVPPGAPARNDEPAPSC